VAVVNGHALRNQARAAAAIAQALRECGEDEEAVDISVHSETDLFEALELVVRANLEDETHVEALKRAAEALQARAARKQRRIEYRRGVMLSALEIADLPRVELAAATLSVARGRQRVVVTDETAIPLEYTTEKVVRRPDLAAIGEAIKAGQTVNGATLSNAMPQLQVRTR
jgi:hypothetical protein